MIIIWFVTLGDILLKKKQESTFIVSIWLQHACWSRKKESWTYTGFDEYQTIKSIKQQCHIVWFWDADVINGNYAFCHFPNNKCKSGLWWFRWWIWLPVQIEWWFVWVASDIIRYKIQLSGLETKYTPNDIIHCKSAYLKAELT